MSNRLAGETSPYLLQHQHNPVDWYPWGEEALSRARAEDRPILLSVGYSACHWCHVMEHESFANPETAALMNTRFINIKVDREERPDIDSIYMQAVQQMTGHGGWPMTVFLKPDGSPFYGGTYFPPEPRHGIPSFRQVILGVSDAYWARRDDVDQSATQLREALKRGMEVNPSPAVLDDSLLRRAFHGIASRFDAQLGGFGSAPKFPQPMLLDYLLLYWARTEDRDALGMAERTLEAMARGGIHDQIGGGFHRYSVDAHWLVPHFEKMLYDNALLSRTYLWAYEAIGREDFREIAESIFAYVEREMRSESGAFYSSQDADSDGEEGTFYVWSVDEVDAVLGAVEGPLFRSYYDISEGGNWEEKTILRVTRPLEEMADEAGMSSADLADLLRRGRERLYGVRAERSWPARDDKAITSWNAMMLRSYAEGARILGNERYRSIAIANAEFILRELQREGRLLRTWRQGAARIDAFLEDHAQLTDALLALYGATFDPRWVREARRIADRMIERFWSPDDGIFYDTANDAESLVLRPRDIYDNATPSGTSAAAQALLGLARLTGEARYERIAATILGSMAEAASRVPHGFGQLLCALARHLAPPSEIAIVGDPAASDTRALLDVVRARFLPYTTVALASPESAASFGEEIPLLAGRTSRDGAATAYACRNYVCHQPVTAATSLDAELAEVAEALKL